MQVLAINGSPNGITGNTDIILQNFLSGMRDVRCATETIYLNKLNIKSCAGCYACWLKTPGKCIHHDDMQYLLPKLIAADLIIYATPLYAFSMTGLIKNFLDRQMPLGSLILAINENIAEANKNLVRNKNNKVQKIFLISNAGLPEIKNFDPLVHTFKLLAEKLHLKYLGAILRPTGGYLREANLDTRLKDKIATYIKELRTAGKQLGEQEMISEELLKKLHEPWMTEQEYWDWTNKHFQQVLKK